MKIKRSSIVTLICISPMTVEVKFLGLTGQLGVIYLRISNSYPLFYILLGGLFLVDYRSSFYNLGGVHD